MKTWGIIFIGLFLIVHCEYISKLQLNSVQSDVILKKETAFTAPSLIQLHTDDLLLSYSENDSLAGHIYFMTSSNQGRSWKNSETVIHTNWYCDPVHLLQIKDHLILLHFSMFRSDDLGSAGVFLVYSYDYGKSFTVPRKISTDVLFPCKDAGNMLELDHGKLLLPVTVQRDSNLQELGILSSIDRGETWEYNPFFNHMNIAFQSPSWVQLENGHLLCQLESEDHEIVFQTLSDDGGQTWSDPVPTQIYGKSAELLSSKNGTLFSVYQDNSPEGISLLYSYNRGRIWQNETAIYSVKNHSGLVAIEMKNSQLYFLTRNKIDSVFQICHFSFQPLIPESPSGFSAAKQEKKIKLRWNPIADAHYYLVYKSVKDSLKFADKNLIVGSASQNSFVDTDIRENEDYFYGVQAIYGQGPSVGTACGQSTLSKIIHIQRKTEEANDF